MSPGVAGSSPAGCAKEKIKMNRFYVVVRADLDLGAQIAQSNHAGLAFAVRYPAQVAAWAAGEQNLVVLSIPTEDALGELLRRATMQGVLSVPFNEPDFGGELTAAAFSGDVAKLVSCLPKAMRPPRAA